MARRRASACAATRRCSRARRAGACAVRFHRERGAERRVPQRTGRGRRTRSPHAGRTPRLSRDRPRARRPHRGRRQAPRPARRAQERPDQERNALGNSAPAADDSAGATAAAPAGEVPRIWLRQRSAARHAGRRMRPPNSTRNGSPARSHRRRPDGLPRRRSRLSQQVPPRDAALQHVRGFLRCGRRLAHVPRPHAGSSRGQRRRSGGARRRRDHRPRRPAHDHRMGRRAGDAHHVPPHERDGSCDAHARARTRSARPRGRRARTARHPRHRDRRRRHARRRGPHSRPQPLGRSAVRLRAERGRGRALHHPVRDRKPPGRPRLSRRPQEQRRAQRPQRRPRGDGPRAPGRHDPAVHDHRPHRRGLVRSSAPSCAT